MSVSVHDDGCRLLNSAKERLTDSISSLSLSLVTFIHPSIASLLGLFAARQHLVQQHRRQSNRFEAVSKLKADIQISKKEYSARLPGTHAPLLHLFLSAIARPHQLEIVDSPILHLAFHRRLSLEAIGSTTRNHARIYLSSSAQARGPRLQGVNLCLQQQRRHPIPPPPLFPAAV